MQLKEFFTNVDSLIAAPIEELAMVILRIVKRTARNDGLFHSQTLISDPLVANAKYDHQTEATLACIEAASWLKIQGLLLEAPWTNGTNGWQVLSLKAKQISSEADFLIIKTQAIFPPELVHSSISETSWLLLARGQYSLAVLNAFRQLEVAVREAANYGNEKYGNAMFRQAFHPETGPLTNMSQAANERQALMELMCGTLGSYKNPHSHPVTDMREAQEMVLLASHLIRIVEGRGKRAQHDL